MKKRIFVYFFSFMLSVFHLSVPNVVFGQLPAEQVLDEYRETFRHPDVHKFFPDVLRFFKAPDIQSVLNPIVVENFANNPRFIQSVMPDVDSSIIVLLTIDEQFQALFRDDDFQEIFQNPPQMDQLATLIEGLEPRPDPCEIPPSDPPKPTTLAIVSGNDQIGEAGTPLSQQFVVGVLDQNGKPIQDISVTFRVTNGGGQLTGGKSQTIDTDEYGQARTTLTLGSVGANRVEASVAGLPKQTFNATATPREEPQPPEPTTLAIVEGNAQIGQPETDLLSPFVVEVRDQYGELYSGATVNFRVIAGGGSLSRTTAQTDENGRASVILTLGAKTGGNQVVASVETIPLTQTFMAEANDADVNGDGVVSMMDLSIVLAFMGEPDRSIAGVDADVNGDGRVDIKDLVLLSSELEWAAAAPSVHTLVKSGISAADIRVLLTQAKALPEATQADPVYQRGIIVLEQLLATLTQVPAVPKQTALLMNYPNPFNPETWIPYQLSEASDVTVSIYAVDGRLIRTLALGHQPAGLYQRKSRAAYWDGRNAFGEPVASGLYFYTLTAGNFTATRKMLIRK